ncbi:thiolase family protein, partial [Ardenticatena maritima]
MSKREAVIVAGVRTAVGKAPRGSLRTKRPDDLAADVLKGLLERVPQLDPAEIEDVIMGCAMPEGEQGLNIGRVAVMRAGLPHSVAGITVNRFCSSGLQTIAMAAQAIEFGSADVVIAGGVESMSMVPMTGHYFAPNPHLALHYPEAFISMGLTAEKVAEKYGISREEQDEFAYRSHQLAIKAIDEGKFKDEIVPVEVEEVSVTPDGERVVRTKVFDTDEGPRRDTSLEALARLRPVFRADGTVTAGNSSQTSDGAAAVLLMTREKAEELGLKPIARVVSFSVGGVPPEIMGIGPVAAVPKALKRAGLTMDDIDLIELN